MTFKYKIYLRSTFHWTFSAGALSSTTADLLKWIQALHRSEKLVKKETYQQLITAGQLSKGTSLRYAMGLQVLKHNGYNVIGHGGSGSGILCDSRYFPEQNLTTIILQNTYRRASESEISYAIADQLLPLKNELRYQFEGNLSGYKGTYRGILEIRVDVVDSDLIIKKSGQTTGDTLTYIGNQKWLLGNDEYSFKVEKGKVTFRYATFFMPSYSHHCININVSGHAIVTTPCVKVSRTLILVAFGLVIVAITLQAA